MQTEVKAVKCLRGEAVVAADKSISHRAVILSALARGKSRVSNFLVAEDTLSSCRCLQALGVVIKQRGQEVVVESPGVLDLREPDLVLDCGNSGTTMRLMTGMMAGLPVMAVLTGDASLNRRPMQRVIQPLSLMGARFLARGGNLPPIAVQGGRLKGIDFTMPVASAQVKSALILAGLQADGDTIIHEPVASRDHTERMLTAMGAHLSRTGQTIVLTPGNSLRTQEWEVPGDISSAAFLLVAGSIVPDSEILLHQVGLNPTRTGVIEILQRMGANISIENYHTVAGEPVADLVVTSAELTAVEIDGAMIPRLIDELPILAVAMTAARGTSVVRDASELRVKETDRIAAVVSELRRMGAAMEETKDGFMVEGQVAPLKGTRVDSYGDHRVAMSLAVAGLTAEGATTIDHSEAVNISFPQFWDIMGNISV